ncbi:MAG: hypothetical protein WCA85_07935 [Paraburkholderia sp.]|uniref:hypothetical protein n=1 Tax=Paraburkholderia sp. TaxID=1926495 RepID=UPI003C687FB2
MFSFVANLFDTGAAGQANGVFSIPNRRNFDASFIAEADSSDPRADRLRGNPFRPEQSYFSIRVVEMRMAQAGNYISTFLPMCSCFVRYPYGASVREVPFIIGYDLIRNLLGPNAAKQGASHVAFKDIYVVRDVPVKAGGVTMYAALCQIKDSSFARGMLDLIGDTVAAIGGPAVALAATTGINMTKRLGALLGADGVETRFGLYNGDVLGNSGYRVLAGAGPQTAGVQMKKGELCRVDDQGKEVTVDDVDYLVIALEYRETLLDQQFGALAHLPFHAKWTELTRKLIVGDDAGADDQFKQLAAEIVTSPDVTEADRLGLLTTYISQMESWRHAKIGANVVRAGEQTLSTELSDCADRLEDNQMETAAMLLRSASKYVNVLDESWTVAEEALSDDAVVKKMALVGAAFQSKKADPKSFARTSAQLLSAAFKS